MQIKNRNGMVIHEVPGDSLEGTDLRGANLYRADLRETSLYGADLYGADLRGAALSWADLREANLRLADLSGAALYEVDLRGASLSGADLREVNLRWADLSNADLSNADLSGAVLRGAILYGADLTGATLPPPIAPEGEFLGYKKVRQAGGSDTVITLRIPADAQRTSALTSRKCRASRVQVVEGCGFSPAFENVLYYISGETVYADGFNPDRREECTNGIHFFMTREEAEAY